MMCSACNKDKELIVPEFLCLDCIKKFEDWKFYNSQEDLGGKS